MNEMSRHHQKGKILPLETSHSKKEAMNDCYTLGGKRPAYFALIASW